MLLEKACTQFLWYRLCYTQAELIHTSPGAAVMRPLYYKLGIIRCQASLSYSDFGARKRHSQASSSKRNNY
jgi:hypothetical protein